jgi:hypothetical protein
VPQRHGFEYLGLHHGILALQRSVNRTNAQEVLQVKKQSESAQQADLNVSAGS